MDRIKHPTNNDGPGSPLTMLELNGQRVAASFWRPTEAEVAAIVAGAPVVIMFTGWMRPEVRVGVEGA